MEGQVTASNGKRQQNAMVQWYPMRIYHSSAKRQDELNELLQKEETVVTTFVPKYLVDAEAMTYVPALVNYIFIRTSLDNLKALKADRGKYENLRYIMNKDLDEDFTSITEVAHVPERQMEHFMRVINGANEQVMMLENMEFACKPGQKVRIRKGPFEGVEGILKSIKKHLCVVIPIHNVMAVAITNVPKKYLQRIDETEI